jgi:hypothetical protein
LIGVSIDKPVTSERRYRLPTVSAVDIYDKETGKYLGQLGGNKYPPDSTNNPYGQYGSKYSADSITAPFTTQTSTVYPTVIGSLKAHGL